jgi:3-(methylthio)propionyl---CoA ligase
MRVPLFGQMMTQPLQVSSLLVHAARHHGTQQIVSCVTDGSLHRYTYRECERRARRLARVLGSFGVRAGDRIGTLAWNNYRHLELYYAISGSAAVCHTINPRLFVEQIIYIINDAQDQCIFFDASLASLVETLAPQCPHVRRWICLCDSTERPSAKFQFDDYESLLANADENFLWPEFDEHLAASLCYTSGTTGNPKGVVYSHRSTVLHSFAAGLPDSQGLDARSVVLPIVPMFHANAWGLPYTALLVGSKLVLPGARLDPASIYELIETEGVTFAAAVPTVWTRLLEYLADGQHRFSSLERALIGGSAVPLSMLRALADHQVTVRQGWGMTETSPLVTTSAPLGKHSGCSAEAQNAVCAMQGRALYGVDIKITDASGAELPWDGTTMGQVMVKGHWVASGYFRTERSPLENGWLPTADIATIDPDGYVELKDRAKDLIKSGGEWISSIDIENIASAHPAVQQAACIAHPHPKWDERPLLIVVLKPGQAVCPEELLAFFAGKVAKLAVPDGVIYVDALPLTATGKLNKLKLREQFAEYRWPQS